MLEPAARDDATANAGSECDHDDVGEPTCCAELPFSKRCACGVVIDRNRATQRLGKSRAHCEIERTDQIRRSANDALARHQTRHADTKGVVTQRVECSEFVGELDQFVDECIVSLRSGSAKLEDHLAGVGENHTEELRPTDIDAGCPGHNRTKVTVRREP